LRASHQVVLRIKAEAADGLPRHEPVEGQEWVVARHAGRIRARPHGNAHLQHPADGWRTPGLLRAVAFDEIFTLKGHAVLHRDAAAKRSYPLVFAIRNGLALIEEPVQASKGISRFTCSYTSRALEIVSL